MKYTNKTKEQLLEADEKSLTFEERILRETLETNPDMTLEAAEKAMDMLP